MNSNNIYSSWLRMTKNGLIQIMIEHNRGGTMLKFPTQLIHAMFVAKHYPNTPALKTPAVLTLEDNRCIVVYTPSKANNGDYAVVLESKNDFQRVKRFDMESLIIFFQNQDSLLVKNGITLHPQESAMRIARKSLLSSVAVSYDDVDSVLRQYLYDNNEEDDSCEFNIRGLTVHPNVEIKLKLWQMHAILWLIHEP